jgi:phage-related protein
VLGFLGTALKVVGVAFWFAFGPIGVIVLALIVLGVALALLWKKSEKFRNIVTGVWEAVKDVTLAVVESIVDAVTGAWDAVKGATMTVWNAISGFFRKWWPLLFVIFAFPLALIFALVKRNWDQIKSVTSAVWNAIKAVVSAVVGTIRSVVSAGWNFISGITSSIWNAIKSKVTGPLDAILGKVRSVFNSIRSFLSEQIGRVRSIASSIGGAIVSGILAGVGGLFGALASKLKGALKGALDSAKNFLGIGSPSKVFAMEVGKPIAQGVAVGIGSSQGDVGAALRRLLALPNQGASPGSAVPRNVLAGIGSGGGGGSPTIINLTVQGSVHAEHDLAMTVRRQLEQHRGRGADA